MGTTNNSGFTILETMLFLAVTGVLIAGILVGVGTSINVQRYRDSVTSIKSFLQKQYGDITNVRNERDNTWKCDATATTTQTGVSQARGQSKCVVIGKYITITGGDVTVATVTAYENTVETGSDIDILKNGYTLGLSTTDQETSTMEWGTTIAWPVSGSNSKNPTTPRSIAILIVSSPDSGFVYTFTTDTVPLIANVDDQALKSMLVVGTGAFPSQGQRTICLDSQGLVLTSNMALYIHAYATNETSIETRSNDVITSLGGTSQC